MKASSRPCSASAALPYLFASGLALSLLFPAGESRAADFSAFTCGVKGTPSQKEAISKDGILGKVQKAYAGVASLNSTFRQESTLAALGTAETSKGEMWFAKPGKMAWHYKAPEEQLFVVRDKTVWLYQVTEKQVIIDNFVDILLTDLPVAFLMGLGDLERDFVLESLCTSPDGVVLDLRQRRQERSGEGERGLKGFKVLIDPQTFLPRGASVMDVGGNVTSIVFDKVKANASVSDDRFAAPSLKGLDVQDRRR